MGTLYLHIGTPKTGTSMIQFFMAKNREILLAKGYSYPDFGFTFEGIGTNRNAHFLAHKYYDEQNKRQLDLEEDLRKKGMELLLQELQQQKNVVLSDEHIWTGYYPIKNFWENIYQAVTGAGHKLKVIVYLRRQDLFIQSYWAQQVKETAQVSFPKYISARRYDKAHLHYNEELDKIAAVVGQENITVRVYERGQYYGNTGSLVADFLHVIGLELTDEYDNSRAIVNGSISGDFLELKRILNKMPEFQDRKNFLIPVMESVSSQEEKSSDYSRAACFSKGQKADFLKQYDEGNRAVAKKYLHRESGILFEEEASLDDQELKPYTKEELVLACGELLLEMNKNLQQTRTRLKIQSQRLGNRIWKKGKGIAKKFLNKQQH